MKTIEALNDLRGAIQAKILEVDPKAASLLQPENPSTIYDLELIEKLWVRQLVFLYQFITILIHALAPEPKKKQLKDPIDVLTFLIKNALPILKSALVLGLKPLLEQLKLTPASLVVTQEFPFIKAFFEMSFSVENIVQILSSRAEMIKFLNDQFPITKMIPDMILGRLLVDKLLLSPTEQAQIQALMQADSKHCATAIQRDITLTGTRDQTQTLPTGNTLVYPQTTWNLTQQFTISTLETTTQQPTISDEFFKFYFAQIESSLMRMFTNQTIVNELTTAANSSRIISQIAQEELAQNVANAKANVTAIKQDNHNATTQLKTPDAKDDQNLKAAQAALQKASEMTVKDYIYSYYDAAFMQVSFNFIPNFRQNYYDVPGKVAAKFRGLVKTICLETTGMLPEDLETTIQQLHTTASLSDILILEPKLAKFETRLTQAFKECSTTEMMRQYETYSDKTFTQTCKIKKSSPAPVTEEFVALASDEKIKSKDKEFTTHEVTRHSVSTQTTIDLPVDVTHHVSNKSIKHLTWLQELRQELSQQKQTVQALVDAETQRLAAIQLEQAKLKSEEVSTKSLTLYRRPSLRPLLRPRVLAKHQSRTTDLVLANRSTTGMLPRGSRFELWIKVPDFWNTRALNRKPITYIISYDNPRQLEKFLRQMIQKNPLLLGTTQQAPTPTVEDITESTSLIVASNHGLSTQLSLTHYNQHYLSSLWMLNHRYHLLLAEINKFTAEIDRITQDSDYIKNLAFYHQIAQQRLQTCQQTLRFYQHQLHELMQQQTELVYNKPISTTPLGHQIKAQSDQITATLMKHKLKLDAAQKTIVTEMARLDGELKSNVTEKLSGHCSNAAINLYATVQQTIERYFGLRRKVWKYRAYDAYCSFFNKPIDEQIRREYTNELLRLLDNFVKSKDCENMYELQNYLLAGQEKFTPRTESRDPQDSNYTKTLHFALNNIWTLILTYAIKRSLNSEKTCQQEYQQQLERSTSTTSLRRTASAA